LNEGVIASIELYNCKSVNVFVNGVVPSIQIDKSESPRITIMKTGIACPKLIVSQVSAGNVEVLAPTAEDADNYNEFPIPEQFEVTVAEDRKSIS